LLKWEIGLSTGIAYRRPIEEVLPHLRRAGLRAIEVSTAPDHLDLRRFDTLAVVARSISELGLRVVSLHAPFGHDVSFTNPDEGLRQRALEKLTAAADALLTLGGHLYVIHPGDEDQRWIWEREKRLALSVEVLTEVWVRCRERGLHLVIETPLPHLLGGQPDDFAWILERLPAEGTSVCLDTSHTSLGQSLYECLERFGPRIAHIQASDNGGQTDDHWPPGEGVVDWNRFTSVLERIGYRGTFMLEIAGRGEIDRDLERVLASVRDTLGGGGPGVAPDNLRSALPSRGTAP
jgi:sugar phosphate isomerase/epimerase